MSVARGGDLGFEPVVGACAAVRDELGEMDAVPAAPVPRLADRSATLTPVLTADLPRDSPPSRPGETGDFSVVARGGVSWPAPPLPLWPK